MLFERMYRAYQNRRIRRSVRHFMATREEFHRVANSMPPDELLVVMQTHLSARHSLPTGPLRDLSNWAGRHADLLDRVRLESQARLTERF